MEDIQLEFAASDIKDKLTPINAAINKSQRDDCYLSERFEIWHELREAFPAEFQQFLCKRIEMAFDDCMMAANLLDHRFCGRNMMPVELTKAKNFIKAIELGLTPELTLYMAKESPYVPDLFDENHQDVRPAAWWKSGARIGFADKLVTIALSLVTAVGLSAGLERQFSTLGMTYGKLRNQLGHEKAGQLAFCYRQLNKNNQLLLYLSMCNKKRNFLR